MTTKHSRTSKEFSLNDETIQDFNSLLGIALDAVKIWPPVYWSSIFGKPLTWLPLHRYSEYTLLNFWRLSRTLKYLIDVTIPSLPFKPPVLSPPFLNTFFFRPTMILHRPDHNQDYTTFPKEAWFFINGIMTNDSVAQLNAAYLSDLFHRPITIIQNTTQSLLIDLTECAFGKVWKNEWQDVKEASAKAFLPIYDALKSPDKDKVIIIAHSQGTIIMSVVLAMLKYKTKPTSLPLEQIATFVGLDKPAMKPGQLPFVPLEAAPAEPEIVFPYEGVLDPADFDFLTIDELAKLEIYCFANCANTMTYFPGQKTPGEPIPWIENFGNEYDIVARLGMFAPDHDRKGIRIDGPIYIKKNTWGHLLNEHYLKEIERAQRVRMKKGGQGKQALAPYNQIRPDPNTQWVVPRLYAYINGGSLGD